MNVQKEQLGKVYSNLSKAELVMMLTRKIGFKKAEYAYKDAYFLKHGTKAIAFLIDNTPECQTTYDMNILEFEDVSMKTIPSSLYVLSMDFEIQETIDMWFLVCNHDCDNGFEYYPIKKVEILKYQEDIIEI